VKFIRHLLFFHSAGTEAFGEEEGFKAGVVFFVGAGEETVGVFRGGFDFAEGVFHAQGDDFLTVGASASETFTEFFFGWGHDKEVHEGVADGGIRAGADLVGALDVDVHDNVGPRGNGIDHLGFKGAVEIAVNFGVFEKFSIGDTFFECFVGEKVVIDSVLFAIAGLAGGAGGGVGGFIFIGDAAAEGGFSRSGRAGDEEEDPSAGGWVKGWRGRGWSVHSWAGENLVGGFEVSSFEFQILRAGAMIFFRMFTLNMEI